MEQKAVTKPTKVKITTKTDVESKIYDSLYLAESLDYTLTGFAAQYNGYSFIQDMTIKKLKDQLRLLHVTYIRLKAELNTGKDNELMNDFDRIFDKTANIINESEDTGISEPNFAAIEAIPKKLIKKITKSMKALDNIQA